jgi:hypothetical protein
MHRFGLEVSPFGEKTSFFVLQIDYGLAQLPRLFEDFLFKADGDTAPFSIPSPTFLELTNASKYASAFSHVN